MCGMKTLCLCVSPDIHTSFTDISVTFLTVNTGSLSTQVHLLVSTCVKCVNGHLCIIYWDLRAIFQEYSIHKQQQRNHRDINR